MGSVLGTDPPEAGPLTVTASRWHTGRLLVSFAEVIGRTDAESLRGTWLTVDAESIELSHDPDEFHDHQLTGLTVVTADGDLVGTVSDVLHSGQALLSVTPAGAEPGHAEILVPFVAAIAVDVDLAAGKLVIDPPPGLLELAGRDSGPVPASSRRGTAGSRRGSAGSGPGSAGSGSSSAGSGSGSAGSAFAGSAPAGGRPGAGPGVDGRRED